MRIRRTACVAVTVSAVLLAAGACGKSSSGGSSSGGGSGDLSSKTVQLIVGVKDDPFYITMICAAQAEAKKLGVKFQSDGSAQWDVSQQRPIINSVAATKPAGLLISPVDTEALTPDLKQMQSTGTKVVLVDTTVTDPSLFTTPYTTKQAYVRKPDWEIREYVCQENNRDAADQFGRPSMDIH